jgi:hypothetical protein
VRRAGAAAVIALAVAALALAAGGSATAADGAYRARDAHGNRLTLVVRDQLVARATVTIGSYRCAGFGDIGPLRVTVAPGAPIAASTGVTHFAGGPSSERLSVRAGLHADGGVSAVVRLRGTIATGDRCASGAVRFIAAPRRA